MFDFTSLASSTCELAASQSLLELEGGIKILVDVGWNSDFDILSLKPLEQHVSTLSLILLTHPTFEHLGAYVHCCKHIPLFSKIPVYATTPVITLGRALLIDIYESTPRAATIIPTIGLGEQEQSRSRLLLPSPTLEEIFEYFSAIHPLKYSQPHQPIGSAFCPPLTGLTITAYGAGHTLGGTIWHVQHGLESIVYAPDWNQGRENLFNGAAWLSTVGGVTEVIEPLRRPTALICSCRGLEKKTSIPRKKRDELLLGLVENTILAGGKTLIPTDSSGRLLELAFLLNSTWRHRSNGPNAQQYSQTRIYVASRTARNALRSVSNMLEWIDDGIRAEAEATDAATTRNGTDVLVNPLDWKHIRYLETPSQVRRAMQKPGPCVVLASDSSLEWGFSRTILERLSKDPANLVIMTKMSHCVKTARKTLCRSIWDLWQEQREQTSTEASIDAVKLENYSIQVQKTSMSSLSSDEDVLYRQYMAQQQHLLDAVNNGNLIQDASNAADAMDDPESESSDSEEEGDESEQQGRTLNLSAQVTQTNRKRIGMSDTELGINVLIRSKSIHDVDVRDKRGREKIFPTLWQKPRSDEFGELIKAESYLRAEERDDVEGVDIRSAEQGEVAMGHKRKWDDVGSKLKSMKANVLISDVNRPKDGNRHIATTEAEHGAGKDLRDDEADSSDESDYEPETESKQGPQKLEIEEMTMELTLQLAYVDFDGLQERRDMQMLIPLIQPRKLILVAGQSEEREAFAEACRTLLSTSNEADVKSPSLGETITASVDTNSWPLKLSRLLVQRLAWQRVKGLGIVALTGKLSAVHGEAIQESHHANKKARLTSDNDTLEAKAETTVVPVLDLVKPQFAKMQTQQRTTQPVHVGDLRLAALRQLVVASGHTAEFKGEGTLLVDGSVIVRKIASGRIEVEAAAGGLSIPLQRTKDGRGSFYAVRQLVYDGLAVVAGI